MKAATVPADNETSDDLEATTMIRTCKTYNYDSNMTRTVLDIEVEGVRPRGRLRYMDNNTIYNKKNGLMDVNIIDRNDWIFAVARATH